MKTIDEIQTEFVTAFNEIDHCGCHCYVSGSEKGRYCRCKGVVYRGYRFEKSDQHRSVQRCEQCNPAYTVHLSVKPDKLTGDQL